LREWKNVKRILVGGGFRDSRIGELVIGRAEILVRSNNEDVSLIPIRLDPDEAGILGSAHLIPPWLFKGDDYIIGVDIGGSNFRCGLIQLNLDRAPDLSQAAVVRMKLWRHAGENVDEDGSTATLGAMLHEILAYGEKKDLRIAPYIGVGCPGTILENGNLEGGTLNLPGDWGDKSFNLVSRIREMTPSIGGHETMVVMHNDAVVQGLSDAPFMGDVEKWAILTIGTGLGNAVYRNKSQTDGTTKTTKS
jgi:predicted NBD/HSP70 family sugar kinase